MSRAVPYSLPGQAPAPVAPSPGNRMDPSSTGLTPVDPQGWKPGMDQNVLTQRGQVLPWAPAAVVRAPFVLR